MLGAPTPCLCKSETGLRGLRHCLLQVFANQSVFATVLTKSSADFTEVKTENLRNARSFEHDELFVLPGAYIIIKQAGEFFRF